MDCMENQAQLIQDDVVLTMGALFSRMRQNGGNTTLYS
jgi:hypothetical protein